MKRQQIHISIPEPCSQNWDVMIPQNEGRHCMSCEKVVVDFSNMSDREMLNWFANRDGQNPCGRYRPDQLNRTISQPIQASWLQRWALLGGLLLSGISTFARQSVNLPSISYNIQSNNPELRIRINVTDSSGSPNHVIVAVYKDSILQQQLSTDASGYLHLNNNAGLKETLRFEIKDQRFQGSLVLSPAQMQLNKVWQLNASAAYHETDMITVREPWYSEVKKIEHTTGVPLRQVPDLKPVRNRSLRNWFKWLLS